MLHDTTMSIVDHSMMLLMGNVMVEQKRERITKKFWKEVSSPSSAIAIMNIMQGRHFVP